MVSVEDAIRDDQVSFWQKNGRAFSVIAILQREVVNAQTQLSKSGQEAIEMPAVDGRAVAMKHRIATDGRQVHAQAIRAILTEFDGSSSLNCCTQGAFCASNGACGLC